MRNLFCAMLFSLLWLNVLEPTTATAQERKATIAGHVTDANHDPLVGARVELQPLGHTAVTDAQGQFSLSELQPGKYTLTISYVGFKPYSKEVTVGSGSGVTEDAALEIESVNEQVIVRGERELHVWRKLRLERAGD
jgi:hypothetical protein